MFLTHTYFICVYRMDPSKCHQPLHDSRAATRMASPTNPTYPPPQPSNVLPSQSWTSKWSRSIHPVRRPYLKCANRSRLNTELFANSLRSATHPAIFHVQRRLGGQSESRPPRGVHVTTVRHQIRPPGIFRAQQQQFAFVFGTWQQRPDRDQLTATHSHAANQQPTSKCRVGIVSYWNCF